VTDVRSLVSGLLALAAAGVAFAATAAVNDESALRERAQEYWEARATGSQKVLEFYAPAEKGGPTRAKDVSEFGNIRFKSWDIEGVEVGPERGWVNVKVSVSFPFPAAVRLDERFMTRTLREEWLKVEGTWYKKPIPMGFSHDHVDTGAAPGERPPASAPESSPGSSGASKSPATAGEVEQP
jgi:hypothetical protein